LVEVGGEADRVQVRRPAGITFPVVEVEDVLTDTAPVTSTLASVASRSEVRLYVVFDTCSVEKAVAAYGIHIVAGATVETTEERGFQFIQRHPRGFVFGDRSPHGVRALVLVASVGFDNEADFKDSFETFAGSTVGAVETFTRREVCTNSFSVGAEGVYSGGFLKPAGIRLRTVFGEREVFET
jgi:hypothetical protein